MPNKSAFDTLHPQEEHVPSMMTDKLHEQGITLHKIDELIGKDSALKAVRALQANIAQRPKLPVEISTYRKYVPIVLEYLCQTCQINQDFLKESDRFKKDGSAEKKGKHWTADEENTLIDVVCQGNMSMMEIAVSFGRSVGAIQTKLSQLVGVKRVSQEVYGRFFGKANGVDAEIMLDGTLYKEDKKEGERQA